MAKSRSGILPTEGCRRPAFDTTAFDTTILQPCVRSTSSNVTKIGGAPATWTVSWSG